MSDALVYNIPAWSKDIDLFAHSDKSAPILDLLPEHHHHSLYAPRRMTEDDTFTSTTALTTTASATTATSSDPASPATEPDAPAAPTTPPIPIPAPPPSLRKPSLPGIGALTPLLDPADSFSNRRASLPALASDLPLTRSPIPRAQPFRSPQVTHRPFDPALTAYSFPAEPDRPPRIDPSFAYPSAPSATTSSFSSPSTFGTSPLSAASSFGQYAPARWQEQQSPQPGQQQWNAADPGAGATQAPSPPSAHSSPRTASKHQATPPPVPTAAAAAPPDAPPHRRRGKLPKHTTDLLKEWLHAHSDHPYPSEDEKRDLCARTKLSMSQVSNWMINARRRILAPAKHPTQAATTTEPYRPLGSTRSIGALYPPPHHHPHHPAAYAQPPPRFPTRDDPSTLRLYDPAAALAFPSPYASPYDRRLSYPEPTAFPQNAYPPAHGAATAASPGAAPHQSLFGLPSQGREPRYFATAPDM